MKKYKLLKDLPFAKAGEELYLKFSEDSEFFLVYKGTDKAYTAELNPEFIDNFDEWFEEIEEPEEYFIINFLHLKIIKISTDFFAEWVIENLKSLGLLFKTEEQAEKHLVYLQAKEVIKQDAKGYKPDWNNEHEAKFFGYWNLIDEEIGCNIQYGTKSTEIYFQSKEDIEESFEKHHEEWKTYLTYEQ